MTDEESFLRQRARQGDAQAIATLLSNYFAPKKITVQAEVRGRCLRVRLESRQAPTKKKVLDQALYDKLIEVKPYAVKRVLIQSWQPGSMKVSWSQDFEVSEEGVKPVAKKDLKDTLAAFRHWFNHSLTAQGQAGVVLLPFGLMFLLWYCTNQNNCEALRAKWGDAEREYNTEYQRQLDKGVVTRQGISDFASVHRNRERALDEYSSRCRN